MQCFSESFETVLESLLKVRIGLICIPPKDSRPSPSQPPMHKIKTLGLDISLSNVFFPQNFAKNYSDLDLIIVLWAITRLAFCSIWNWGIRFGSSASTRLQSNHYQDQFWYWLKFVFAQSPEWNLSIGFCTFHWFLKFAVGKHSKSKFNILRYWVEKIVEEGMYKLTGPIYCSCTLLERSK